MDAETLKILANLGGPTVIAVVMLLCLNRIFSTFGAAHVKAQQQMAEAVGRQAQSMCDMKDSLHTFIMKDNSEHREILLALQVVGEVLKSLTTQIQRTYEPEISHTQ